MGVSSKELRDGYKGEVLNRSAAIKAKCLDCCCGQRQEVVLCPINDCPLWPYRLGTNPFSNRKPMSDEQKEAFVQRTQDARKKKGEED